jgi:hypothetical protein
VLFSELVYYGMARAVELQCHAALSQVVAAASSGLSTSTEYG